MNIRKAAEDKLKLPSLRSAEKQAVFREQKKLCFSVPGLDPGQKRPAGAPQAFCFSSRDLKAALIP
jgi:hypothetical protein